ncbi:MAG: hypothetical protein GXO23_06560 [Crenarchaeota archaeon]|nr:hypothetical protein [Thermoproteota archaeon]
MVINLAQDIAKRIESILDSIDLYRAIREITLISSEHVDVTITYTLGEYENTDKVISKIRAATSLFQRTLIIVDSYTFYRTYNTISRITVRGGIEMLVLDYDDVRDDVPNNQVILESTGGELPQDILKGIELSETLEEPVIVRAPVYTLNRIGRALGQALGRESGIFYRDWKTRSAWIAGDLITQRVESTLHDRLLHVISDGSSNQRILIDHQLRNLVKDMLPNYTLLSPKIYTFDSLKKIVNKESDLAISTSRKMIELAHSGEHVNIAVKCLEKYAAYVWQSVSRHLRPLLSLMFILQNIYRELDMISISKFRIPATPSRGKYDIRLVTRVPSDIFDVVDIVLEQGLDALRLFETKLPKSFLVIYLTDVRDVVESVARLKEIERSRIVTLVDDYATLNEITSILRLLNIRYIILDISNNTVNELRRILETPVNVVILFREKRCIPEISREYCDKCELCIRIGCKSITMSSEGPTIDPSFCEMCHACVLVCTRGAIRLSQESHS